MPIKTGLDQILGFGEGFERILPTQIGEEQNIPFMVGFLFDKIPVMRNVLLSSARLNYFIYLAALRLLEARADWRTAVVVSVVVCITIPMIVNNLGLRLHSNLHEFLQNFISHNRDITQLTTAE